MRLRSLGTPGPPASKKRPLQQESPAAPMFSQADGVLQQLDNLYFSPAMAESAALWGGAPLDPASSVYELDATPTAFGGELQWDDQLLDEWIRASEDRTKHL